MKKILQPPKKELFFTKFDVLKYKQQKENGIDFNLSKYLR